MYIAQSRPFTKQNLYFAPELNEMQYQQNKFFPLNTSENILICVNHTSSKQFNVLAVNHLPDYHLNGDAIYIALYRYVDFERIENITDWGLEEFQINYQTSKIIKQDIFYYTYAVLHSPVYRRKYEQNLKREFPRLPFYEDFFRWRDWGKELMNLHIYYETQEPFALERKDLDLSAKRKIASNTMFDEMINARIDDFVSKPQTKLRADKENGAILLDSITTLTGVPHSAWEYKLGNRSALEWILDQYKERKPQDATIAERFNTYKFEDYKEQVIDLLKRVCNVSVKTMEIIEKMPNE